MHADEVDTDPSLVQRLVAGQFPEWAELPIEPVFPLGTDNANYRLGDEMIVRLPRQPHKVDPLKREFEWLPVFAPSLPSVSSTCQSVLPSARLNAATKEILPGPKFRNTLPS